MRTVSITEFRANMAKEIADLLFALTKDAKVVAKVCTEAAVPILPLLGTPRKSVQKKVVPIKKSVQNEPAVFKGGYSKEHQTRKKAK